MRYDDRGYSIEPAQGTTGVVPIRDANNSRMLYPSEFGYEEPEAEGFDFWSILRLLLSRKWMILAITLLGVIASFVLTLRVVPLYQATASIEIQREEVQIIEGTNVGPDLVADSAYMETLYKLLQSRFLAERVANDLNLPSDPRYANQNAPREQRVQQAARQVVNGVRVIPVGRSRVVNIRYVSRYPKEAARIANAVVEAFIQSSLERKYNTTAYAREFLDERLASTKLALEQSERELVRYAEQQGILDLGGEGSGASLDENSISILNAELSQAESARISAEQEYLTSSESATYKELLESPDLGRLRQVRAELVIDYQELLGKFKPDYPDMVKLQTRIDALEADIEREENAIITSSRATYRAAYDAAVAREQSLRNRVDELRKSLQEERNRRIEYTILQREVGTLRSQYQALLERSKEVSISSGIGSSNISIVDAALVPGRPFQPNMSQSIVQGFLLSFGFAIALAFFLSFLDDTIKSPEDVKSKLGLPAIGVIPKLSSKKDVVINELENPRSKISEAFASARTGLDFATQDGAPRTLLVTSTRPGEGKTSTTISLATVFAKGGKKVLVIDADMRKPSFVVDSKKSIGLSGLLTGHEQLKNHVIQSKTENLSVLPSGVVPPNPAQLLSGPRLRELLEDAEQLFDIVIIDSPPVLSFTDSPRLGSVARGTLVVVQSGIIRTPAAQRTIANLYESRSNVVGVVLTKFDARRSGYDYSYYYANYGNSGYSYVESNTSKSRKRQVQIEAADDLLEADESERWA